MRNKYKDSGSKPRGKIKTKVTSAYGWFMLRFDRKQQNSVKQLSFNQKKWKKSYWDCWIKSKIKGWREDHKITEGLGYQREKINYIQRGGN